MAHFNLPQKVYPLSSTKGAPQEIQTAGASVSEVYDDYWVSLSIKILTLFMSILNNHFKIQQLKTPLFQNSV